MISTSASSRKPRPQPGSFLEEASAILRPTLSTSYLFLLAAFSPLSLKKGFGGKSNHLQPLPCRNSARPREQQCSSGRFKNRWPKSKVKVHYFVWLTVSNCFKTLYSVFEVEL